MASASSATQPLPNRKTTFGLGVEVEAIVTAASRDDTTSALSGNRLSRRIALSIARR